LAAGRGAPAGCGAPVGSPAGTTVRVWVDAAGREATPPPEHPRVDAQVVQAALLAVIALALLLVGTGLAVRHLLDQRRLAAWDVAGQRAEVEPPRLSRALEARTCPQPQDAQPGWGIRSRLPRGTSGCYAVSRVASPATASAAIGGAASAVPSQAAASARS
jgi:hypothetical protein